MNSTRLLPSGAPLTLVALLAAVVFAVVVFTAGCGRDQGGTARAEPSTPPAAHRARGEASGPVHAEASGSAHAEASGPTHAEEAEASDLDRPLEELMRLRCEHGILTYKCDECRYETGMVKVAPDLLDEDGPLETARVTRRATEESMAHNGEVRLNEEHAAWLSPRAAGTVRSILVDLGANVRQGQVLFTVDSPEFAEARSAYLIAQTSLKLAEGTFVRERDLYEKKVCPRKDLLEAEAARDEAAATLQAAKEHLLACGLTAREIAVLATAAAESSPAAMIDKAAAESPPTAMPVNAAAEDYPTAMPVKAPFDGTVLERTLGIGARVEPGEKLLLLADTSEMWVWTSLYERELPGVLQEQARGTLLAHVEIPAYPGRIFPGRVERMSGIVDETTRTARVRVVVDNKEGLLRAGMFARVHLHGSKSEQALTVPADAVLEDEGRSFVFVPAEPPYFVRRPVMVGRAWEGWVEVTQGLEENDVVVSRGAFALKSDVLRSKMGAGCAD